MPINNCELCDRERELTFHHLIPKKVHSRKSVKKMHSKEVMHNSGIFVCDDCHRAIHKFFDHITLAREYYSKELLQLSKKIATFVSWLKKQDKRVKL